MLVVVGVRKSFNLLKKVFHIDQVFEFGVSLASGVGRIIQNTCVQRTNWYLTNVRNTKITIVLKE